MNNNDITLFGITTFRNKNRTFGIKADDRRRHMYIIGKTGMGKSTLLENMIINDIRAGRGVAVVDPHGDLAEKVIDYIPNERINDVIYFNPSDMEFPIAFNVVEKVEPHLRHLVASGLIGVFQKLWADSWGPRLEYILRNTILAVLDYPGATLLAVTRMLSDKDFRKKVVEKIQDPVVKSFWAKEFAGYADKFASEAVSPIQNKVGQFLSSSLIRNIIGQVKSSIDVRKVMDEGKILILNLSKGRIGEDNSALLGSMMITKIQLAAMSRVDLSEDERKDFYLYVDEFQNFATDSFANILSEARKYHLNLIMGHQYIEQLGEIVEAAVFGNVGTLVVFRVGATDAEELVKEFTPTFTEEDLVNLPKYEMYLKLMIDGISSDPFSARGLPPLTADIKTFSTPKIIKVSRERYAGKREAVEEKIMRWHSVDEKEEKKPVRKPEIKAPAAKGGVLVGRPAEKAGFDGNEKRAKEKAPNDFEETKISPRIKKFSAEKNNNDQPSREAADEKNSEKVFKYESVCSRCQAPARLSFPPDGVRPVFCRDCLAQIKIEKKDEDEARKRKKQEELSRLEKRSSEESASVGKKDPALKKDSFSYNLARNGFEEDWRPISLKELSGIVPVDFGRGKAQPSPKPQEQSGETRPAEANKRKNPGADNASRFIKPGETVKIN